MDNPLIVQVLWTLNRGGAERMVFDLARTLPSHGFRVLVISANGGGDMVADFEKANVPLVIGPAARRTFDRLETVRFLREQIRTHKPSVWHTHLGSDLWGGWAAIKEKLHPWIITAHGLEQNLPSLLRHARRFAFRRADRVACVSDTVRQAVKREYGVSDDRLSVIPNGVDISTIRPHDVRGFPDIPRLVTVGRLVSGKNQAMLLRALSDVKRPWHLTVVGGGPDSLELQRLASSLGIMPRIRFVGSVSNVSEYLDQADVFCFPSLEEGQGIALLEAAATGLPIIANDLPAFRESFDETSALLVKEPSAEAWRRAIIDTLSQPTPAFQRAAKAQTIVRGNLTLEGMTDKYTKLYQSLL